MGAQSRALGRATLPSTGCASSHLRKGCEVGDIEQSVERAALLAYCKCRPDRAVERLRAQRDELLVALEGMVAANTGFWDSDHAGRNVAIAAMVAAERAANKAIAKAKGET